MHYRPCQSAMGLVTLPIGASARLPGGESGFWRTVWQLACFVKCSTIISLQMLFQTWLWRHYQSGRSSVWGFYSFEITLAAIEPPRTTAPQICSLLHDLGQGAFASTRWRHTVIQPNSARFYPTRFSPFALAIGLRSKTVTRWSRWRIYWEQVERMVVAEATEENPCRIT